MKISASETSAVYHCRLFEELNLESQDNLTDRSNPTFIVFG